MTQSLSNLVTGIALTRAKLLSAVKGVEVSRMAKSAGRYRPEEHYMRGPGPKWPGKTRANLRPNSRAAVRPTQCDGRSGH
jgi:hypothetical protein